MKRIIFRVDDRLIHGQVIEGWIKHFKIPKVIVVNDRIAKDALQRMIYESILPAGTDLEVYDISEFQGKYSTNGGKDFKLIIFESVSDLFSCRDLLDDESYLNIGCVASREHKIEISDTVFLDMNEIVQLNEINESRRVFIHKLPWETSVEIKNVVKLIEGTL